ncbi:MAG: DUF1003 domain-containing protein [Leptolyngbya foveolarum]|uniref:DUF1003 domain-containing protein n=1 Tax=Leptolyngbya foveolarum TaxID=47253 RepID=A0A2W4UPW0_9CYAN|nr:MAG: DUF1003 domain-containing protein [Leptolyngbya foveolarum]
MPKDPARDNHAGSVIINGEKYPLPAQVIKNIETVINLQTDQERRIPASERILSKVTAAFGRSRFLYSQLAFFAIWGLTSHFAQPILVQWDLPVMNLESHGLDMAALLITTGVLVRQTQQDKIAERRSHLMLQINLLNEQKIAKVIELIEELRKDTPDVANRFDWEAKIMQQATDPQVVLNILQENLEPASHQPEDPSDNQAASADQAYLESNSQSISQPVQSVPIEASANSTASAT